jgi:hypothetical protein
MTVMDLNLRCKYVIMPHESLDMDLMVDKNLSLKSSTTTL